MNRPPRARYHEGSYAHRKINPSGWAAQLAVLYGPGPTSFLPASPNRPSTLRFPNRGTFPKRVAQDTVYGRRRLEFLLVVQWSKATSLLFP